MENGIRYVNMFWVLKSKLILLSWGVVNNWIPVFTGMTELIRFHCSVFAISYALTSMPENNTMPDKHIHISSCGMPAVACVLIDFLNK
jgi:hypothetical protein